MNRFITIRQVDGSEDQYSERDLPLTVGSEPGNHLLLPGSDQLAAYIDDAQGYLFIQPAENLAVPLLHNDRQLRESAWLKSNDRVRCESFVVRYECSGERIIFSVAEEGGSDSPALSPPSHPPPGTALQSNGAEELPVDVVRSEGISGKKKVAIAAFGLMFVVLSCAVLFVLLARPLELDVSPEPDSVAVSGFFPVIKIGGRYLLLPAHYSITVQKKGYRDFRTDVQIDKSGDGSLQVKLEKLPGLLNLRLTPPDGVEVYSGDRLLVTTPPNTIEIAAGPHQLTLKKPRYLPHQAEIVIEGREIVQDIAVSLEPDWADITIDSKPAGAEVIIDGTAAGTTPLAQPLLSGSHEIELRLESHTPSSRPITVQAGIEAEFVFELTLLPGQLSLTSLPTGAAVSIGSDYKGTTPLSLTLPSGLVQDITLSRPGYKAVSQSLTLTPGEERKLLLELEQEQGVVFLTTTPPASSVTINGTPYTDAQGALTLPAQPQTFVVSASGYKTVSRTVTPNPAYSQQLAIDLPPESATGKSPLNPSPSIDKDALTTAAGQRLLVIQPAPFMMGAPRREPGRRANERQRQVAMKRPFLIGEKLVTNGDYRKFAGSHSSGVFMGSSLDGEDQPVVNITWDQAVSYLNWLSEQDDLEPFYEKQGDDYIAVSPPTNGYRLPSEAEWAFTARQASAREIQRYPWTGGFPPRSVVANLADESARTILPRVIQGYNDTFPVTSPVGYFPANQSGIYDIGGNASEWCHDYYSAYTGKLAEETDPLGPRIGTHKVIRGSNWRDASLAETRLSYRAYHKEARNNVGFRIARYL